MTQSRSVVKTRPTKLILRVRPRLDYHKLEEQIAILLVLADENRLIIAPATVDAAAAVVLSAVVSAVTKNLLVDMPSMHCHDVAVAVDVDVVVAAAAAAAVDITPVREDPGPKVDSNPAVVPAELATHEDHAVAVDKGRFGIPIRKVVDAAALPSAGDRDLFLAELQAGSDDVGPHIQELLCIGIGAPPASQHIRRGER